MKIYLKLPKNKKFANITALLKYGYKGELFIRKGFAATYSDKACKKQQCHNDANRSFEDLLIICKTYFPKTTEEQLAKSLYGLFKYNKLIVIFCDNINKLVFYRRRHALNFEYLIVDEATKRGVGKYNYNEFMELVNS